MQHSSILPQDCISGLMSFQNYFLLLYINLTWIGAQRRTVVPGVPGVPWPGTPQILADQLTLSQPG